MEAGKVVELKSGGPAMTIRWIEDDEAYCEWFDSKKVVGAKFALIQLQERQSPSPFA